MPYTVVLSICTTLLQGHMNVPRSIACLFSVGAYFLYSYILLKWTGMTPIDASSAFIHTCSSQITCNNSTILKGMYCATLDTQAMGFLALVSASFFQPSVPHLSTSSTMEDATSTKKVLYFFNQMPHAIYYFICNVY